MVGIGVQTLRQRPPSLERDALLRSALRDSGEQALREFVAHWHPTETASAVVLYEDRKVATRFLDIDFPVTLMTTRAFVATVSRWGANADAVAALEAIATLYDLKPALVGEIDPGVPVDLRPLPRPSTDGLLRPPARLRRAPRAASVLGGAPRSTKART